MRNSTTKQILSLQKSSSQEQVKTYFQKVFELKQTGKEFPVNLNDVWPLVYPRKDHAVRLLKDQFMEDVHFQFFPKNGEKGRPSDEYWLSVPCLEFFIASRIRPIFEVYRQVFHKAIENQGSATKSITEQAIKKEGEVYWTKLGTETIKAYYNNGEQYYALGGIMKFLGFMQSGGGSYARKYDGAIQVRIEKQNVWFVNFEWINKICTSRNPRYELVSAIYRDLFNMNVAPEGSEYAFRFTDKKMIDIIAAINLISRPAGIKEKLLNSIMEGRI